MAAAAQNMLLAAHALGFAAKWSTGKQAYDATVKAELGLGETDRIIGFLYLGSAAAPHEAPPRAALDGLVAPWPKPGDARVTVLLLPWLFCGCCLPAAEGRAGRGADPQRQL